MNCQHDPTKDNCTLTIAAAMGGTDISCSNCTSRAQWNMGGEPFFAMYQSPEAAPEDSPQLRIAEFEQVSAPPETWVCAWSTQHKVGAQCHCAGLRP